MGKPLGLARFRDRTAPLPDRGRARCDAWDTVTERRVRLVTATGANADLLVEDLARLEAVAHPVLVPVLAHGREGGRAWAAQPLLEPAAPEADPVRVAARTRDLAGALTALGAAGIGISALPAEAVRADGDAVRLDPLALMLGAHDPRAAARALGVHLTGEPGAAQGELAAVASAARAGAFASPEALTGALPAARARRRRRPLVLAAAGTIVVAAAVAGVVVLTGGGGQDTAGGGAPGASAPDGVGAPETPPPAAAAEPAATLAGSTALPAPAASLLEREGTVWVGTASGTVVPVADGGRAVGQAAPVAEGGSGPVWLAAADGRVWAFQPSTVTIADAGPAPVDATRWLRLGFGQPIGLAAADGTAWMLEDRRLVRVALGRPPALAGTVALPWEATAAAALPGRVLVAGADGRMLSVPEAGEPVAGRAGGSAGAMATAGGAVWVADPAAQRVVRVAPGRPRAVVRSGRLPGRPVALAADGRRVWAVVTPGPGGAAAALVGLDAGTGRAVGAPVPLPAAGPVAAAGGTVWVAGGRDLIRFSATR